MKTTRRLLVAAFVLAVVNLSTAVVQAQFNYTTNNGAITIAKYTGFGGAVTIPSTTNGLPVTAIGDLAFYMADLTSVTIPNSVTTIGAWAFEYCGLRTNLFIPNSITSIGQGAFAGCYVGEITVDESNPGYSSWDGVLFNKSQTMLIQFPAGSTAASYTIPNGVTNIGDYAFSSCNGLISVTIPDGVTSIRQDAFWNCRNLTSATIPGSVTRIEDWAFAWTGLNSVTIPDSVTSIGGSAFSYCLSLTSVTIGNSVTNIADSAFAQCSSLSIVRFLGNAPSLGEDVFDYREYSRFFPPPGYILHYDPATVYYLPGATGWGPTFGGLSTALWNPQSQMSYTITNGTVIIRKYTGSGGEVTIPDMINGLPVTSIGEGAFSSATNLSNVTIPNSVTNIGRSAFSGCTGLTSVTIPNSVTSIEGDAFTYCTSLTSVKMGNSVASIGESAFFFCTHLTTVTLPDSLTSIGENAFGNCSLTNVAIPNSVTSMGYGALFGCTALTNVTIGNGLTNIGIGASAFGGCISLSAITVDPLNPTFSSVDGVLFDKSQTTLIEYPVGKGDSYTIPNGVNSIGVWAFSYCTTLTNVTIPNGVTIIGDFSFIGCSSLTNIAIPNSVTKIGVSAFATCYKLYTVAIPDSVTSIGTNAFEYCGLIFVTIGDSVTSIADQAFSGCDHLRGVIFEGNAPLLGQYVFAGDNDLTVCYKAGTTGWGTTFGGRPTALWNPQAQTTDGSFGVRNNQFGFNIAGTRDIPLVIESCTKVPAQSWIPLQTCTLTNGLIYFSDPEWTNYPSRFYRIRWP